MGNLFQSGCTGLCEKGYNFTLDQNASEAENLFVDDDEFYFEGSGLVLNENIISNDTLNLLICGANGLWNETMKHVVGRCTSK